MWRFIISVILLLVSSSMVSGISPASELAQNSELFLPMIIDVYPPPFDVAITLHKTCGPPPEYRSLVYGYAFNTVPETLYTVILEVDINIVSCFDDSCSSFNRQERISPALPALIPGQINPFHFGGMCEAKIEEHILGVRAVSASRTEPEGTVYYPLTIVSWEHADDTLYGTIRNENQDLLQNLRLVAQELEKCGWREAEIASTSLEPGLETTFTIDFPEYCLGDNLVIVGQGAVQP